MNLFDGFYSRMQVKRSSNLATTIHKWDTDWVIFVPYTYAISYGCTHGGLV